MSPKLGVFQGKFILVINHIRDKFHKYPCDQHSQKTVFTAIPFINSFKEK